MADTTALAASAADAPSGADIERVQEFTREPILLEGETFGDLHPGSARRQAFDDALAEIEEGFEEPSPEWRSNFSLLLGLERVLAEDRPLLRDGAELSEHQVDALSGTLAAIIAEIEEPGSNKAGAPTERRQRRHAAGRGRRRGRSRRGRGAAGLGRGADDVAEDEEIVTDAPDDPGASRRFWFEHATGAGKTVAAVGFVEASRTGGILILTHRRNLVDQFIGEISDRGYADRLSPPLLKGKDNAYGPVTVETYQWFVRNAGKISQRLLDRHLRRGPHRARREDQRLHPRLAGARLHRHDRDRRADRPPRRRPLPDPDLALRPRAGRPPRRDRAAALHPDPAGSGRPHARQRAAAPR